MPYIKNLFSQQPPQLSANSPNRAQQYGPAPLRFGQEGMQGAFNPELPPMAQFGGTGMQSPQYSSVQQPQMAQSRLAQLAGVGMQPPRITSSYQPQPRVQPSGTQSPAYRAIGQYKNQFAPVMPTGPQVSKAGYYNPSMSQPRNQFAPPLQGMQQGNVSGQQYGADEWQQRRNQFIPRNRYWED